MKCLIKENYKNLPDFLIVGTAKAGTTSMHFYLDQHPSIVMPQKTKETLFWQIISNPNKMPLQLNPKAIISYEEYLDQFMDAGENQICGESCPSYLYYYQYTINNLKKYHPGWRKVKIIIVLREPVSKIVSQYHFVTNTLKIRDNSLKQALKLEAKRLRENNVSPSLFYVDSTRYFRQVEAYLREFENVRVLFYEDFKKDGMKFLHEIFDFIGVRPDVGFPNMDKVYNASSKRLMPRNKIIEQAMKLAKATIPVETKKFLANKYGLKKENYFFRREYIDQQTLMNLRETFKPEVKALEGLLNKDLTFWGY